MHKHLGKSEVNTNQISLVNYHFVELTIGFKSCYRALDISFSGKKLELNSIFVSLCA